jgi:uncharacterized Tic20 family protein
MLAHLGALLVLFVSAGGLGWVAPLVALLAKGKESAYIRHHATESLNFQITLVIAGVVLVLGGGLLAVVTFGLALFLLVPVVVVIAIGALIVMIQATIKASNGEHYRYPLTLRLVP